MKQNNNYWLMALSLLLGLAECIYTVVKRKGEESKWFCPSVLFFLISVVPVIWIMELELLDQRLASISGSAANVTSTGTSGSEELSQISSGLSSQDWVLVLEQLLLFILIIGRWLLPKGEITRDQLSQLLLVYLGMAADIIEIFEAFSEDNVMYNRGLIIGLMTLWSWALMQFTLVYTATRARQYRSAMNKNAVGDESQSPHKSPGLLPFSVEDTPPPKHNRGAFKRVSRVVTVALNWQARTGGSPDGQENSPLKSKSPTPSTDPNLVIPIRREDSETEDTSPTFTCLESDTWAILAALMMQDGPFLLIRVILIARYQVLSYLNIFFTCKNALVITLQVYRLVVVQIEEREKEAKDEEKQVEIAAGLLAAKFGYRFPVAFVDPYAAAQGPGASLPYAAYGRLSEQGLTPQKRDGETDKDSLNGSFR